MFDYGISALVVSLVVIGWGFLFAYAIRHRVDITQWMNAADYCRPLPPDRKTALERTIKKNEWKQIEGSWQIEDAKAELAKLIAKEKTEIK